MSVNQTSGLEHSHCSSLTAVIGETSPYGFTQNTILKFQEGIGFESVPERVKPGLLIL